MANSLQSLTIAVALTLLAFFTPSASAQTNVVTISLKENASTVKRDILTVGDVAEVSGGAVSSRMKIGKLDLEAGESASHCVISRRQVEMRLMLAGFRRQEFHVVGPDRMTVTESNTDKLQVDLEKQIQSEIARQFGLAASKVSVNISSQRQLGDLWKELGGANFNTTVLVDPQLPVGRTRIQLEIATDTGSRITTTLDTRVVITMTVAVAVHPIQRGAEIRDGMFRLIERPLTDRKNIASPDRLVGRVAKQQIPGNNVILSNHLVDRQTRQSFDVKTNALLDVIINIQGSQVRLKNAKALGSANRGETIAVMNTKTGRRFNAKVIDKHLAEVQMVPGVRR